MTAIDQGAGQPHPNPPLEQAHRHDAKVMGLIGVGHFFSHFYIMVLPPLFPLLRDELGVGYTALGFALAVLNVTTAVVQTPVGFLVDRFGARRILIAGLGLFALATVLIGVFPSYPMLLVLMVLAGLGNSVFHPADYAILSSAIDDRRVGRAFSIHTFGGYAGFALAPPVMVFLTAMFGWQMALILGGVAGLGFTLLMAAYGSVLQSPGEARPGKGAAKAEGGAAGIGLLLTTPVLLALLFFTMLAMSQGGYMSFSVAAIEALYGVALAEANLPLTAYLVAGAVGVLAGGWVADRTADHHRVVAGCFLMVAVLTAAIPVLLPPIALATVLFASAGFFAGVVAPSRDMMVRAVTPPGAHGRVFGFVTMGFNIGGVAGPVLFGAVLDYGDDPSLVFWTIAALSVTTLLVIYAGARSAPARPAAATR